MGKVQMLENFYLPVSIRVLLLLFLWINEHILHILMCQAAERLSDFGSFNFWWLILYSQTEVTFRPSVMPGPLNDFDDVLLALSKLDLKTSCTPTLVNIKQFQTLQRYILFYTIFFSLRNFPPNKTSIGSRERALLWCDVLYSLGHPQNVLLRFNHIGTR